MFDGSIRSRKLYFLDLKTSNHRDFAMAVSEDNNFHPKFVQNNIHLL